MSSDALAALYAEAEAAGVAWRKAIEKADRLQDEASEARDVADSAQGRLAELVGAVHRAWQNGYTDRPPPVR